MARRRTTGTRRSLLWFWVILFVAMILIGGVAIVVVLSP